MTKKKVLIVCDFYYPHWTGIVTSIFNITQALKNSINFTVLTVQYDKKLKRIENNKGIEIFREPYLFSFSRVKYSVSILIKIIKIIRNFEVIFISTPFSNILPVTLIAKLFAKKVVIFHQGDLILPKSLLNWIIEKLFDITTLFSFLLADKVSTYTKDYALDSRVLKFFLNKFTPLIPPILIKEETQNKNNSLAKISNKLKSQNKTILGFGGRFVEEKGFDILVKAIPIVIKNNPKIHFIFAGETNIKYENTFNELKNQFKIIEKHITFLGLLDRNQLKNYFKAIDFIVIPSRSDCFPLFQAEAMLSGKPSIVSDIPGARYLVKSSGFGLIFTNEDPNNLAQQILKAISRKEIILKSYPRLLKILNNENNAERFREFIEQ